MKNLGIVTLLVILSIGAIPIKGWAQNNNVFAPYATKKIPNTFYFTPAVSSKEFAIFGYMSKITPTPDELKAEKERINKIIDESIKGGYGSWGNFEKEMREAGKQTAQKERREAPSWLKSLLPPSLIKEAVPLLMKGALLYVKTHPEAMREPVGNVGETGVIVVDKWGNVTKVPLGINAPVESISISSDRKIAAVLTDMSYVDRKGHLHPVGEISFIDLKTKRRTYSKIFANLAGHIAFVPRTNWLAFDYYTDMKNFGKQDVIKFFDFKRKKVLKYKFHTPGNGSASVFGKNINYPGFQFGFDPKSHTPIIALYNKGNFEIYNVITGKKLLKVLTNGHTLTFAHKHPWVFTGVGEWWDYQSGKLVGSVKLPSGKSFPAIDAKFTKDDSKIIYVDPFGCPKRFDTRIKKVVQSCDFYSRAGLFFLTPDDQYIVTFMEGKGMVSYKKHYLKRSKLCLNIIDTQNLRLKQKICPKNSTVIDAAMAGDSLIFSDFDKLYIYKPL